MEVNAFSVHCWIRGCVWIVKIPSSVWKKQLRVGAWWCQTNFEPSDRLLSSLSKIQAPGSLSAAKLHKNSRWWRVEGDSKRISFGSIWLRIKRERWEICEALVIRKDISSWRNKNACDDDGDTAVTFSRDI